MILQRYLARILQERSYLASAAKSCNFLKESCKETSDLLNRHFLQEKRTNQKSLARIFQDLAFLATLARLSHFSARIMHYLTRSCKKLASFVSQINEGSREDACALLVHDNSYFSDQNSQDHFENVLSKAMGVFGYINLMPPIF